MRKAQRLGEQSSSKGEHAMSQISNIRGLLLASALMGAFANFLSPETAWALGSTPVTVVNPTDIAKASGIQHPYQDEPGSCAFGGGDSCTKVFNPPANQRVVIEYVSGACAFDGGAPLVQVVVVTTVNGIGVAHRLAITDHNGVAENGVSDVPFGQMV